jgi:AcrR family transcriptional regulator
MTEKIYERILRAAAKCFSQRGFNETTMDEIAKEAGVSKGALYWHFKSKEALFVKLKEQAITKVLQTLKNTFGSSEAFSSKLTKGFQLYFSQLTSEQRRKARLNMEFWTAAPKIVGLNKMLNEQYDNLMTFLETIVEDAKAKGEIRNDVDSRLLSAILLATMDGLELHWAILEKDFDWSKITASLCDILLNGLKPRQGDVSSEKAKPIC